MNKPAVRVTRNKGGGFNLYHHSKYIGYRLSLEDAQAKADELNRQFSRERFIREEKRRKRQEDGQRVACCGINIYFGGNRAGWQACHRCGSPLRYYDSMDEAFKNNLGCPPQPREPAPEIRNPIPVPAPNPIAYARTQLPDDWDTL